MLTRFCDLDDGVLLRGILPICWQNQGEGGGGGASSGGSGDAGAQGGDGDAGAGDAGAGDAGAKDGEGGEGGEGEGDKGKGKGKEPDYITPRQLQGVLDAHKRTSQAEFKKFANTQSEQTKTMKAIADRLEALQTAPPKSGDDDKKRAQDTENAELKRQLAEMKTQLDSTTSRADEADRLREDNEFQTTVKAALNKAGCTNPEEAYLVIHPRLKTESGRIFATVKTEFGEEDLELDAYVEREFSENILPQLFRGKMRTGSPASGDVGGGKGFQFTREQLLDNPEAYAADPEKARAALEAGQVKGVPKPSSGQAHQ